MSPDAGAGVTAIRLEGPGPSVEYRCAELRAQLSAFGDTEELHSHNSAKLWREVRDVTPFAGPDDARCVWRLSVPPTEGPPSPRGWTRQSAARAFSIGAAG